MGYQESILHIEKKNQIEFIKELQKIYSNQSELKILSDTHNKPQAEIIKAYKFPVGQNLKDEITLNILNTMKTVF